MQKMQCITWTELVSMAESWKLNLPEVTEKVSVSKLELHCYGRLWNPYSDMVKINSCIMPTDYKVEQTHIIKLNTPYLLLTN
jgi:hypothetical protein